MKILTYKHHDFEYRGKVDPKVMGTCLITKPCDMSTGYRGRGKPIYEETILPGTQAKFNLNSNGSNTVTWLTVIVIKPDDKWGSVELRKTVTFELPFEAVAAKLHLN